MASAIAQYAKEYRRDRILGRPRRVAAGAAVAHVQELREAGATFGTIAHASGVPIMTLWKVAQGRCEAVSAATARRLLSTSLLDVIRLAPPDSLVPATGAIRRLRALAAIGHSFRTIASYRPNPDPTPLQKLATRQTPGVIRKHMHDSICVAFEALSMTPGRSEQSRRDARRRSYMPVLAWDEGTIDQPDAVPHGARIRSDVVDAVAVRRRMEGERIRLTQTEARAVCEALYRQGLSAQEVCRRTGLKPERYLRITDWQAAA